MSANKIELETAMELSQAAKYLEDLAECFRQGKIVVEKDGQFVTLTPPEIVKVEVVARQKKEKDKFELSLSWRNALEACQDPGLAISSQEPQPDNTDVEKAQEEDLPE